MSYPLRQPLDDPSSSTTTDASTSSTQSHAGHMEFPNLPNQQVLIGPDGASLASGTAAGSADPLFHDPAILFALQTGMIPSVNSQLSYQPCHPTEQAIKVKLAGSYTSTSRLFYDSFYNTYDAASGGSSDPSSVSMPCHQPPDLVDGTQQTRSLCNQEKRAVKKMKYTPQNETCTMKPEACSSSNRSSGELSTNFVDLTVEGAGNESEWHGAHSMLQQCRTWETISTPPETSGHGIVFTLATYNVLAQNLMEDHPQMYQHCPDYILTWSYRSKYLLREIQRYQPDILCLQEVNGQHYNDFFEPELEKLGYNGEFKQRTNDKEDGCAIFYKYYKFKLAAVMPVEYLNESDPLLDRDNVALLLLLRAKKKKVPTATLR